MVLNQGRGNSHGRDVDIMENCSQIRMMRPQLRLCCGHKIIKNLDVFFT